MALIKRLLSWMLVLIVVLAVVGLFLPDRAEVSRSTFIDRPPEQVFALLNSFERFNEWSPWARLDPDTRYTFGGPDTGIGAEMSWSSEMASVGTGSQRIVESQPFSLVRTEQNFGDMGITQASFELSPQGQGTQLTWRFSAEFGYNLISRYAGLLFDNMVGQSYEQGLANLRAVLESEAASVGPPAIADQAPSDDSAPASEPPSLGDVIQVEVSPRRIALISATTSMEPENMAQAMGDAYGRLFAFLGAQGITPTGPPLSITRSWDPENNRFAFDAAVPVPDATLAQAEGDVRIADAYSGPALKLELTGSYDGLPAAHERISAALAEQNLESAGDPWEEYLNSPDQVAESELVTHIFYPVRSPPSP